MFQQVHSVSEMHIDKIYGIMQSIERWIKLILPRYAKWALFSGYTMLCNILLKTLT